MPSFLLTSFFPSFVLSGKATRKHKPWLLHHTEFGSLAVKNATRLVSAAKVEKGQGLDPIKLSFQGHFFLDSKLHLG